MGKSTEEWKYPHCLYASRLHWTPPLTQTPVQFLQHSGDREEINTIQLHLASLNFTYSEMHHPIYELSGGQQGKLYLLQLGAHKSPISTLGRAYSQFSPLPNQKFDAYSQTTQAD